MTKLDYSTLSLQLFLQLFFLRAFVFEDADGAAESLTREDFAFHLRESPAGCLHIQFADHMAGYIEPEFLACIKVWTDLLYGVVQLFKY